jgi:dolichol-phosphate mannosyltransferase
MKSLLIISSALNEEDCLPEFIRQIQEIRAIETNYRLNLLIFDNGSSDGTWKIIADSAFNYEYIKGVQLSRTFILDSAFTAGIDMATQDVLIVMASDLQDPPSAISDLLRQYELGYEQVLVKIKSRPAVPMVRRNLTNQFYRIAGRMTDGMIPESVSDFRLMDRKVYEAVRMLRENHRFFRGLGAWVGFKTGFIEINRPPRHAGKSGWLATSLLRTIGVAARNILAFSAKPLSWISIIGIGLFVFSFMATIIAGVAWVLFGVPFAGYGSIIGLLLLGFSLIFLVLGVISQYLSLIYNEVRARPLYLISRTTWLD